MAKKKKKKKTTKKKLRSIRSAAAQSPGEKPPAKTEPAKTEPAKVVVYPDAGKKITEFEQALDVQLAAGEPAPPKRGRPRKDEQPEPEFAMTENLIAEGLKTPFELWAIGQKLDELKLQDKEAAMLAGSVKQLLDYYLPDVPMIAIAWASLAITTKSIMAPRLALIADLKKQKAPNSSAEQTDDKDEGHGRPRPSTSPAPAGDGLVFPKATEPVKI